MKKHEEEFKKSLIKVSMTGKKREEEFKKALITIAMTGDFKSRRLAVSVLGIEKPNEPWIDRIPKDTPITVQAKILVPLYSRMADMFMTNQLTDLEDDAMFDLGEILRAEAGKEI